MSAVNKKRWWQYIHFEFYLRIPFINIQTRMLTEAIERMTYDICRVRVEVWKWKWEFQLYKKPDMHSEPSPRLAQRLALTFRKLIERLKNAFK